MEKHYKNMSFDEVVIVIIYNLLSIPADDRSEIASVSRMNVVSNSERERWRLYGSNYVEVIANLSELAIAQATSYNACCGQAMSELVAYQKVASIVSMQKIQVDLNNS